MHYPTHVKQLRRAYDADAKRRKEKQATRVGWKAKVRQDFAERMKTEGKESLLEIGAGVGTDSLFFQNEGLKFLPLTFRQKWLMYA